MRTVVIFLGVLIVLCYSTALLVNAALDSVMRLGLS